jgi:antirestriction protein ArdC
MTQDIYREVSDRDPCRAEDRRTALGEPWSQTSGLNIPANAVTGRPYSGPGGTRGF